MENKIYVSVYALIQNSKGRYLFIKRSENDSMPGVWEVPGGKMDYGEDPKDSLKRETMEEVGLSIEPLNPFCVVSHVTPVKQVVRVVYKANLIEENEVKLSKEHFAFKWSDFSDPEVSGSIFLQQVLKSL